MLKYVLLIILLFIPGSPLWAAGDVSGVYATNFNEMTLTQSGKSVTGTYKHRGGRLEGTLDGDVLTGWWYQSNGKGRLRFEFKPDRSGFAGKWSYNDAPPKESWNGVRIIEEQPADAEAAPPALDVTGVYDTDYRQLTLRQQGNLISGEYTHQNGKIDGVLHGYVVTGRWSQSNGSGKFSFRFAPDGSGFEGKWGNNEATPSAKWNGVMNRAMTKEYLDRQKVLEPVNTVDQAAAAADGETRGTTEVRKTSLGAGDSTRVGKEVDRGNVESVLEQGTVDQRAATGKTAVAIVPDPAAEKSAAAAADLESEPLPASMLAGVPEVTPSPFLDLNTLTARQWDGAVTAAMEGMRMVYGPMSADEEQRFVGQWGVLRQHPSEEAVEYLNRFNPLLGEFLSLRGAIADQAALLEQAYENAGWAAETDEPVLAMEYIDMSRQYRTLLLSSQKRLDSVIGQLLALGNPPHGGELMAQGQEQYQRAKNYLRDLVAAPQGPEGEWVGYIHHSNGVPFLKDQHINSTPIYFFVYGVGQPAEYYGIMLDAESYEEKVYAFVEPFAMTEEVLAHFEKDRFRYTIVDEDEGEEVSWAITAHRYTGGEMPIYQEVAPELFVEALGLSAREKQQLLDIARGQEAEEALKTTISAEIGDTFTRSAVEDVLNHYRARAAFHEACRKWASMPESELGNEEENLALFDSLVAGKASAPLSLKEQKKEKQQAAPEREQDAVPVHIVDDKDEQQRKQLDTEAIQFHADTIAIIERNMERDREELARELDPFRKEDLQRRILGAMANIQSEQDRIDSLKTGVVIHNRSAWDDFARSQFVQNIAQDQQKMEKVSRAMRRAYQMAESLPYGKAQEVREAIAQGFSPQVMSATDTKAAAKVIVQVYGISNEFWLGEKQKADADAEWADTCLETAETIKSGADNSLLLLSFVGGSSVSRVYQGVTGYIDGGPKEAFLRIGGSYNQLTGIAVDGYRGFEAAVDQGGGWQEGFMGAGWEIVKGIVVDKAMQVGANGVLRGYGALKGGRGQADGPSPDLHGGKVRPVEGASPAKVKGEVEGVAIQKAKPAKPADDGFNRPLTEADRKIYREQVADARTRVNSYKKTFEKLQRARQEKAPPTEIKKILRELDDRSAKIHASPQAKLMMKSHQRNPKNKEMVKRFCNSMDRIHGQVQKRFHEKMGPEWSNEQLSPIRNADSGKSVNMDYDIARTVKFDAEGRPIPPMKNGKPVPEALWQAEAQKRWEEAYAEVTGQSPGRSWETVTTSTHPEAYRDLNIIEKNGILRANKNWAEQTADVNQFKGDHLRGAPEFQRVEKHVEIARSTSKECDKRLFPLLDAKAPPQSDAANYAAWKKHRDYWSKMNAILSDMGNGRIDPLDGDRRIRLLSGGKSSLEVTHDLRNFMESLLKL